MAPSTPNQFSYHQPSLSFEPPDCLGVRSCHAESILTPSAQPSSFEFRTASEQGACDDKSTFIPSAQPLYFELRIAPNTARVTPNPCSRHQPSILCAAPDCLRTRRLPRQIHSHAVSPACALEILVSDPVVSVVLDVAGPVPMVPGVLLTVEVIVALDVRREEERERERERERDRKKN